MKYFFPFVLLLVSLHGPAQPVNNKTMALDSIFRGYFKDDEPGASVLIVKDGQVLFRAGYGVADITTGERITPLTLFNLGSISKTVVAYGILKLAERGKLSLDDSLVQYFPGFANRDIAGKVKLEHLLTHTSGLPDSRRVSEEREFYLTAKDEENFAPLLQTQTLQFTPGTKYKYSNPAFNGLALVIERVAGKKWQQYIGEEIFRPAGMSNSLITDGAFPDKGVSHAYTRSNGRFEELDYGEEPTFAAAGNGGVWSNVDELWKYEQAIQASSFLTPEWIRKSRTVYRFPGWADDNPPKVGLSWFITKERNYDVIGHTGSQGGFISDYLWIPEKKFFYVLLCNVPVRIDEIRRKVFDAALD